MELRPEELLKEWRADALRPAYLLVGEDAALKDEALAALKARFKDDSFNFREYPADADAASVVAEASTLPVFSQRRLILVKNPKLDAAARAAFAEYLKDPLKSTTLILLSGEKKPEPRDALAKAVAGAGAVCVFGPLSEAQAVTRLRAKAAAQQLTLSSEAAQRLIAEAGTDWSALSAEFERILLYCAGQKEIGADAVLECLGFRKSADPFALTRLIAERRLKESLEQLRRLFAEGKADEQAFRCLSQISGAVAKQLRAKRLKERGVSDPEIFRQLRLHPYWDRDYMAGVQRLSELRLRRDVKLCLDTEAALKSKAWLNPRLELESLVAALCAQALTARAN